MPQDVNFFWHGPKLRRLELACLASFHRHGHRVVIHCYNAPENFPSFAERFDAARLMPERDLLRGKRGNVAIGADRYRYRMIEAGLGLYSDTDMFCLAPIMPNDYIMGWQSYFSIANGFLHYPPGSDLSKILLEYTERSDFIPPWLPKRVRWRLQLKRCAGALNVSEMPWGTWGPKALSHAIQELGLQSKVQPIDHYYAFPLGHLPLLIEPELSLRDLVTPRSKAIHLWNSKLADLGIDQDAPAPAGTPLDEIMSSRF